MTGSKVWIFIRVLFHIATLLSRTAMPTSSCFHTDCPSTSLHCLCHGHQCPPSCWIQWSILSAHPTYCRPHLPQLNTLFPGSLSFLGFRVSRTLYSLGFSFPSHTPFLVPPYLFDPPTGTRAHFSICCFVELQIHIFRCYSNTDTSSVHICRPAHSLKICLVHPLST